MLSRRPFAVIAVAMTIMIVGTLSVSSTVWG
jgi:hypothetical protein